MKNYSILILISFFLVTFISSSTSQVRLGLKAGLNLSSQNYDNFGFEPDTKLLPGIMFGGIVEFGLGEKFSLGTGLQYHGKGAKISNGTDEVKYTINSLQIPLQIQFHSNGFFGAVGPYLGFAIGGKLTDSGDTEDLNFGSSEDDDFSQSDYGINIEAGYEFGANKNLRATAFYSLGLANVLPKDVQDLLDNESVNNTVIGVSLTYLFGN